MADNLTVTGETNPEPDTCVDAKCCCNIIWSLAQQFAMRQIVTHAPTHNHMPDYREGDRCLSRRQLETSAPEFVSNYELRARRIAAAYARVFLEDFHLGDKSKIGRFYWLGLGAFASKQVAATLHQWQVKYLARWSELYEGLGRGNLWLFNDVLAWFYGYAAGSDTFMACAPSRNSEKFVAQVSANFKRQKGYAESIDKIPYVIDAETGEKKKQLGYLQCTPTVMRGFNAIAMWELIQDPILKATYAFAHLLAIAQHEQGEVLQGLIYDDPSFCGWLGTQRIASKAPLVGALVPSLRLVLSPEYQTDDEELNSDAPEGLVLEDYRQRMSWIKGAARKYHNLMQGKRRSQMYVFLTEIKSWGDAEVSS
ncbi:hypothetical protein [Caballeronia sp. GAFFF1]|uniref:DUF2515 family protein n=1 Tax=Caballeronia sp. GAFFF1 TaxID=2921779 RepID=UPI00202818DE|nr:hypothetical protein [Caballeronia sp. GAFFF1]